MDIKHTIKTIFKDKARSNEMFTAVDVTKQIGDVAHRKIREALHDLWSTGEITSLGYTRSLQRMNVTNDHGQTLEAYVYHPRGVDPSNYTNREQTLDPNTTGPDEVQYAPQPSTPTVTVTTSSQPRSNVRSRYLSRHTRSDGAIEIPGVLVSKLQAQAGDTVYGLFDQTSQELVISGRNNGGIPFTIYKTGETRVPKRLVEKHFPNNTRFSVRVVGSELRIS